jgi:hypothetical protein
MVKKTKADLRLYRPGPDEKTGSSLLPMSSFVSPVKNSFPILTGEF